MYNPIARIHLNHLRQNYQLLQERVGSAKILAVVKADAYGHGLRHIARTLEDEGLYGFAVALSSEVRSLLEIGIQHPILHLGRLHDEILDLCCDGQARCTLHSIRDLDRIRNHCSGSQRIRAHLKIDTGMGRMGVSLPEAEQMIREIRNIPQIQLEGIWSHLATAESEDESFLSEQAEVFSDFTDAVISTLPSIEFRHLANSAALLKNKNSHFNMVRPGVALFGVSPLGEAEPGLLPVMEFRAPLVLRRELPAGATIGYQRTFSVPENGRYGILQVGYADGLPLDFSGRGRVFHDGESLPIVGKVSMDMTSISLSDSQIRIGDMVTIWGGSSPQSRIEVLASEYHRLPYEFLTGVSKRVIREFMDI